MIYKTYFKSRVSNARIAQYYSEYAICHIVRHGNVNSIQNPSTVTTPTMEPYCRAYSSATYVTVPYNVTNRKLTYIS